MPVGVKERLTAYQKMKKVDNMCICIDTIINDSEKCHINIECYIDM